MVGINNVKVEKLTIAEIDDILVKMEACLDDEENKINKHAYNNEPDTKEQAIWNCVAYHGYVDVLKTARARLVVRNEFDSVWDEKDRDTQVLKACKLITTIAREGVEMSYLCVIGPLLQPPRPVKALSKKEEKHVRKELACVTS